MVCKEREKGQDWSSDDHEEGQIGSVFHFRL